MLESARPLLIAVLLVGSGLGVFAWRLVRIDAGEPERLIGELRFAQWHALVLASIGGGWMGLAAGHPAPPLTAVEITQAILTMIFAAWTLQRETGQGLLWLAVGFVAHALIDVAHRPGWLTADLAPRWFTVGCAVFDIYLAALCYWVQKR